MSQDEIDAAYGKARRELKAIEQELAGLHSELTRLGGQLIAIGDILANKPENAWNIDIISLVADIQTAGDRAKRYSGLQTKLADKYAEVRRFEQSF
jgi:hypothetical protein